MVLKTKYTGMFKTVLFVFFVVLTACSDSDYTPKPNAKLRLEYPKADYVKTNLELPFVFDKNTLAKKVTLKQLNSVTNSYGINLEYPALKGTIFLTYKAIENNKDNLLDFLKDAQKLTLEHAKKADEMPKYPFENNEKKVYGILSEVKGNVASPTQFYITDSVNHFLTGSLYFRAKPNYDSILPAANYLQKDIKRIMESMEWK